MSAALLLAMAIALPAQVGNTAPDDTSDPKQLTRLSLEELADLKVVSVSKREENNLEAPGSIYVITNEDLRRTGAASQPDSMRMAPGLTAARVDGDEWALAIRGFSSRLSRSVLAVVDGRSVWTPLYAGIFWDAQDSILEDTERIEVSRGPGGAVFGANAMNGVINITTKSARDTTGGLAALAIGSAERIGALRWGGTFGDGVNYRVFGKYSVRDGTKPLTPAGYDDEWTLGLGGFRLDWDRGTSNAFTLLGNLHDGHSLQPTTLASFTPPYSVTLSTDAVFQGQNILGRWSGSVGSGGTMRAQMYVDHTRRVEPIYEEGRTTVDVDLQYQRPWGGRHDFIGGLNYRRSDGTFDGSPVIRLDPPQRTDDVAGLFVNNETRLVEDKLRFTVGSKFEWNDYTGWNAQPSARVAYVLPHQTFWGSWTRALRTSSRVERDIVLYSSLSSTEPTFAKSSGSDDFKPESVVAFELGYKLRLSRIIFTAAAFRNDYGDIAANATGTPFLEGGGAEPRRTVIPVLITNGPDGKTTGFEANVIVPVTNTWRVQGSYSYQKVTRENTPAFRQNSPRNQFWLTSYWSPLNALDIDLLFRVVDPLPNGIVTGYTEADFRVGYRATGKLELSVIGANLLHSSHAEFAGGFAVERSVRAQATVRF